MQERSVTWKREKADRDCALVNKHNAQLDNFISIYNYLQISQFYSVESTLE